MDRACVCSLFLCRVAISRSEKFAVTFCECTGLHSRTALLWVEARQLISLSFVALSLCLCCVHLIQQQQQQPCLIIMQNLSKTWWVRQYWQINPEPFNLTLTLMLIHYCHKPTSCCMIILLVESSVQHWKTMMIITDVFSCLSLLNSLRRKSARSWEL